MTATKTQRTNWTSPFIKGLFVLSCLQVLLVLLANIQGDSKSRAIILMASGLWLIWVLGFGLVSWRLRDQAKLLFDQIPGNPFLKFFLFAVGLLLLEEAVTTTMTNLAPLFGSRIGEAYITGSANYLEVVMWHSVVVLWPAYAAWALVLRRVDFHPNAVFLFYGLQGVTAEAMHSGPAQLLAFPFWIFIYGLMIYLPAWCLYGQGERPKAKGRHYAAVFFLTMLLTIPVALGVMQFRPPDAGFPAEVQRGAQTPFKASE